MLSVVEEATRHPVVLVVEDEPLIRSLVAEYLRMAGCKVIEAANAAEAVAVFASATMIHLVLSDVNMPGLMDGIGLARWISHHHPGVHVILTSAISHAACAEEIAVSFLPKPYRLTEAALRVRSLLDHPQQRDA
jgi:DNA-binding NtrC family response regulator